MYHLERWGRGIIWSSRESYGGVCIIWRGRVSSEAGEYHLETSVSSGRGGYHSGVVCIIWLGRVSSEAGEYLLERVYHLEWECIIWRGVSSGGRLYHLEGCISSGRGGYHLEQESIIWRCVYHLEGVGGEYHLEQESIILKRCVSSGRGGYHLERENIIWRGCVSSGREWYNLEQESIIWKGRVSSGSRDYHLEGFVSSGGGGYDLEKESIIWMGMYHLERWGRGIICSRRELSVGVCIICNGKVSSGVGEYHQEG
jgi:hypothetical protein